MKKVPLLVAGWRLLLFLPLFFLRYIPAPQDTRYFGLSPWANFDGDHYLAIVTHGYDASVARFFPLYPMIIKAVIFLFSLPSTSYYAFIVGLLVSNISFLAACIVFYKLLRLEYPHKTSLLSVFFLLLFPTSFFFGSIYAESIFLLLAVSALYLARKQQWFFAIIMAILLPLARPVGIAILPALFVEWWIQEKEKNRPSFNILLSLIFIPLGLAGYAAYNYVTWGSFLYFIRAQGELANGRSTGIVLIPQTLFRYGKMLMTVPISQYIWWIALLELAVFVFAGLLLYIAYIKKVRLSYLAFALIALLIPTSTGTFSGFPRYAVILFPLFVALALIKNMKVKIIYAILSIILSFVLLLFFMKGYYVA